jgi:hypothetical protein
LYGKYVFNHEKIMNEIRIRKHIRKLRCGMPHGIDIYDNLLSLEIKIEYRNNLSSEYVQLSNRQLTQSLKYLPSSLHSLKIINDDIENFLVPSSNLNHPFKHLSSLVSLQSFHN